jgi:hypothetical protein
MIVILKPLDEQGCPGYGIADDGNVWSRWDTHGKITEEWSQRETYIKRKSLYVKLQICKLPVEKHVAKLLLGAVFGTLHPWPGFMIRYANGRYDDCRLVNLSHAPLGDEPDFRARYGARFANVTPPGFSAVNI